MYIDGMLELADALSSTVSVASTNTIDTLADGMPYGGSFAGAFFLIRVDTSYVAGLGAPTAEFQLQTSDSETFANAADTLVQSDAYIASELIAGRTIKLPIPSDFRMKRYIRGYQNVTDGLSAGNRFSTSIFDMYITKDVNQFNKLA